MTLQCARSPGKKGFLLCRSHQKHLVHGGVIGACFGMRFMNDMDATSNFHRMGCHFLRVKACVRPFVEKYLERRPGSPPAEDQRCAAELEHYMSVNLNAEEDVSTERRRGSGINIRERMRLFFRMCNGGFIIVAGRVGKIIPYCYGPECCEDDLACIDNVVCALR